MELVDQQETLSPEENGWLAGIIDGEGTISMNVRKKQWRGWSGIGVDLTVCVSNTDAGIIEKAVLIFRKIGVEPHIFESQCQPITHEDGTTYSSKRTLLRVSVSRMADILKVLTFIGPFLAGEKKSRARLIAQFIERRMAHKGPQTKGGPSWYDGYDWELVRQFYVLSGGRLLPEVQAVLNEHTRQQASSPA